MQDTQTEKRYAVHHLGVDYDLKDRDERIAYGMKIWEPYICSTAMKFSNSVCGFDDVLQEANVIIILAANAWDINRSFASFATYLYACLRNGLMDLSTRTMAAVSLPSGSLKHKDKVKSVRLDSQEIVDDRAEKELNYSDLLDTVEQSGDLPIIQKYFVEGYTLDEVSRELNCSISTVQRRVDQVRELARVSLR